MVNIEKIEYAGWPNCYRISNQIIELIVTADVGPRVIRFGFIGDENEFFENPEDRGKVGGDEWRLYGGHRLWHGPEDVIRTYMPDNFPLEVTLLEDGIILTAPIEKPAGVQKSIEIHLAKDKPQVSLLHNIRNTGLWPVTLAPWAITVMNSNGTAIIPQTPRTEWPKILLPTHSVTFWGYTRMSDPRWTWGDQYILLTQKPIPAKEQKIGLSNTEGWGAYLRNGHLFIKKFDYFPEKNYLDRNSNFECFTNQNIMELESLGPVQQIAPNQVTTHREEWHLFKNVTFQLNEKDIQQNINLYLEA